MINIEHIQTSINNAEKGISQLPPAILGMEGMSSNKVRHFLNNVCNFDREIVINYLEVGVWRGSTFCSAIFNNCLNYAVAIDNFTEFNEQRISNTHIIRGFLPYNKFQSPFAL
jgi:hypothetical protein